MAELRIVDLFAGAGGTSDGAKRAGMRVVFAGNQVQGFRPDYLDGVPRTAALIMAGNAVPPDLACGVLEQVAAA